MATRPDTVLSHPDGELVAEIATFEAANDNEESKASSALDEAWRRHATALPADAFAIIEPDPLGSGFGGRAREGRWRLRFRERYRQFADPLTGWTGGCDPLAHLTLDFPSRATAEGYCLRQGLPFEVRQAAR
jgi:hypothetical protein